MTATETLHDAIAQSAHDADTGVIWTGPEGETVEAHHIPQGSLMVFDSIDENGTCCGSRVLNRTSLGWYERSQAIADHLLDSLT